MLWKYLSIFQLKTVKTVKTVIFYRYHLSLTNTSSGTITLDHQFCDRATTTNQLNDCLQGFGFNTSLEIPLSRHFKDQTVNLNIQSSENTHGIIMCPVDSNIMNRCNRSPQSTQSIPATENPREHGSFHINVGLFRSIYVKFRQDLRRPTVRESIQNRRNICSLSDSKLGILFQEFNVRFYRLCHV